MHGSRACQETTALEAQDHEDARMIKEAELAAAVEEE